jgi:1,4-alpha-glucan branching enzyme
MLVIVKRKRLDKVQVTFVLDETPAEQPVFVAGDFNDWSRETAFKKAKDGSLRATVTLPPGEKTRFRYVTSDGTWFDEPRADGYEENGQGGTNCIVLP